MDSDFDTKFKALQDKHKQGLIVGLADINGVVPRLDIDVLLYTKPKTFNLFALALRKLKQSGQNDIMGYFQIAGKCA